MLAGGQAVAVGLPWSGRDAGADRISVAYDDGSGQVRTRTLSCGGAVRAEQLAACRQLDELGGPLAPVPAGQMCSMIYGGPQTAHVTGMWRGEPVDETYRRTNGCEVARWKRMIPALPEPTSGGPHILAA
ncbi:SSI family serine proteinase inhibitor [Streptomyces sp. NRRL F-5123]|uniref:SSI family serine proteinase inhibitor n=1 Tax=Streptomyces sp. NRRL F-5123 TaxID=1463856 RepID=UPI0006933D66|nr:SSI family serine proteinase inhibitor [Streptomyces sp. NRRL F-5123]